MATLPVAVPSGRRSPMHLQQRAQRSARHLPFTAAFGTSQTRRACVHDFCFLASRLQRANLSAQGRQRVQAFVALEDDAASVTAIAAVGTTERHHRLPPKRHTSIAAGATFHPDGGDVKEAPLLVIFRRGRLILRGNANWLEPVEAFGGPQRSLRSETSDHREGRESQKRAGQNHCALRAAPGRKNRAKNERQRRAGGRKRGLGTSS
eukprot:scaffold2522_cov242-Pinguiococcus_pyrenoidosus.AAC.1